ncbi:uncharacterized protein LOC142987800 [Anticarsia gemmatalis]|uniref:uncharacterized protein LOC142987800 n=1 Tax=Anticarsia gemmatalis TaxID=129554 RepID=UPI003F75CA0D
METALLACVFAAFALTVTGAPTYPESEEQLDRQYSDNYQYLREARSQYAPQYVTPCAAAAAAAAAQSVHLPAFAAPYHLSAPGYNLPQYGYRIPHYRSVDEQLAEPEILAFSDMDQLQHAFGPAHLPMARYGSPGASVSSGLALNGGALTVASGPAYGVFPNANVAGCNIPLLFSCSPSISSGHLVESSHGAASAIANSYRHVEEQPHQDVAYESSEVTSSHQHLEPAHETGHVRSLHA